jgi:ribosome biogenesis GTPase
VIDTPGLRGLAPDIDADALAASFEDIRALAAQCRFRDCTHIDEPGCAVRDGVAPDRLANYQKMLRDLKRETMTPLERRALVSQWKVRHKAATARMKLKRG